MNISDTTWHQMTIQFITSPNVWFCTTSGKKTKRNMSWNMQKHLKKTSPTLLIVTWSVIVRS